MKKVIYLLMMCAGVLLFSCEKDEIGGTATEALAGEWTVTVDAVDGSGNVVEEDFFGLGRVMLNTYNTAANLPTEMYVDDLGNFWEYKVKVQSDVNTLTFATSGAATTPHGTPADSIVYYVSFSDDEYPAQYGYAKYKVSGYRYTGLAVDD